MNFVAPFLSWLMALKTPNLGKEKLGNENLLLELLVDVSLRTVGTMALFFISFPHFGQKQKFCSKQNPHLEQKFVAE
jgi:hypothetical protein